MTLSIIASAHTITYYLSARSYYKPLDVGQPSARDASIRHASILDLVRLGGQNVSLVMAREPS